MCVEFVALWGWRDERINGKRLADRWLGGNTVDSGWWMGGWEEDGKRMGG
jgi:hypothetical protein